MSPEAHDGYRAVFPVRIEFENVDLSAGLDPTLQKVVTGNRVQAVVFPNGPGINSMFVTEWSCYSCHRNLPKPSAVVVVEIYVKRALFSETS